MAANPVKWLEMAGKAFLLAFAGTAVIYAPGVFEAPNLETALALGVAGAGAAIAAALLAVKAMLPSFSLGSVLTFLSPANVSRVDLFVATFVGTFIVAVTDFLQRAPDLTGWKLAIVPALTGAAAAAFRTLVGLGTPGESPLPEVGVGDSE